MSSDNNNNGTVNSYALHDILLGIATSLNEAEQQLRNQPPYDAFGRPNTIYHVPYLDFNLRVTTEFEEIETTTTNPDTGTTDGTKEYYPRLLWAPAPREKTTGSETTNRTEIYSSLSGRFVASVPNEGLPQVIIGTEVSDVTLQDGQYKFTITATVSNAANELLPNTTVEFNFDEARTDNLNDDGVRTGTPTIEGFSEITTDANAQAVATIVFPTDDFTNTNDEITLVFILNVGPVIKLISISNQ